MRFRIGDTVKLKVDKSYPDGTNVPAGTRGIVEKVYEDWGRYLVDLGRPYGTRRVPEADLERA